MSTGPRWLALGVATVLVPAGARAENPLPACNEAWHAFGRAAPGERAALAKVCKARCAGVTEGQAPARLAECAKASAAAPGPAPPVGRFAEVGIELVAIEGGTFRIGSDAGEADEKTRREVTLPDYQLSKSEVTVGQYRKCVDGGPCTAPDTGEYCNWDKGDRESHPVNCVDHKQAQVFAKWVGGRLPSEAEWEYAARSRGREQKYPWGDEDATCERAVMPDGCSQDRTWAVCEKRPGHTAQGLCDMAGNVWEWVEDTYYDSYENLPTDGRAWTDGGADRVYRGGGWDDEAARLRASNRAWWSPGVRLDGLGFRVAFSSPRAR